MSGFWIFIAGYCIGLLIGAFTISLFVINRPVKEDSHHG